MRSRDPSEVLSSLAAIMVRESVGSLASRAVTTEVVSKALAHADKSEIPLGGDALRRFIEVHLHASATVLLGLDAADAILHMLGPIVHRIPSAIPARLSTFPKRYTQGVEISVLPDGFVATVLLATLDVERATALESALRGVSMTVVHDVVALLDLVAANALAQTVMIVDCISPSINPATLATVAPEMAASTEFVLWEASEAHGGEWLFADRTDTWVRCPVGAQIGQVAKAIRALMIR